MMVGDGGDDADVYSLGNPAVQECMKRQATGVMNAAGKWAVKPMNIATGPLPKSIPENANNMGKVFIGEDKL